MWRGRVSLLVLLFPIGQVGLVKATRRGSVRFVLVSVTFSAFSFEF